MTARVYLSQRNDIEGPPNQIYMRFKTAEGERSLAIVLEDEYDTPEAFAAILHNVAESITAASGRLRAGRFDPVHAEHVA
jgi:hypothetical protein